MLDSLTIRQVALIEEATIRFHRGMQVLTGETGAGKSIVVDSVNLILGGRADRDLIRSGSDKATVEAVFSTKGNEGVKAFMDQENIEYDGETVTVYREISSGGRNLCRPRVRRQASRVLTKCLSKWVRVILSSSEPVQVWVRPRSL